jgi:hypothetical protein
MAILESVAKSLSYWSIGNGDDTMVTLWNPADEAQDFVFTLFFSGGHYAFPLHMEGRVTRTFNVSEIVNSQIPDAEGNRIPPSVEEGSAELTGSQGESQHILVAMEAGTYNVRKATCGLHCITCNGATEFWIAANPFSVAVKKTTQLSFTSQYNTGKQYNLTSLGTWSSTNTKVATVASGLLDCTTPGTVGTDASYLAEPLYSTGCYSEVMECPLDEGADAGDTGDCTADQFNVSYISYIPADHVNGPDACLYGGVPVGLIYKGDLNRGTFRTSESVFVVPDAPLFTNQVEQTGTTENYGFGSPVHLPNLSSADEDGLYNDCHLANEIGHAGTSGMNISVTFPDTDPYTATVGMWGGAPDPLISYAWPITWNMAIFLDDAAVTAPTAYVVASHTCYPAHTVTVNGTVIYNYTPTDNSLATVTLCLAGVGYIGPITGATYQVPAN